MNEEVRTIAEQCSRPQTGVHESTLFELRPYLEDFLDRDWLDAMLRSYETWASTNSDPMLQRNLLHRPLGFNLLVAAIWAAREWERIRSEDPAFPCPGGAKRLAHIACSLSVLELHANRHLNSNAREHLRQRLQAADELWGAVHEINTFAHFVRKGAEVEPAFLRKASCQEIIVNWQGCKIPVQCKAKKPGAGRHISKDSFVTLAGSIARDAKKAGRCILVSIGSTGPVRQSDIEVIRRRVARQRVSHSAPVLAVHDKRTFALKVQPLTGHFTRDSIMEYLADFGFHTGMIIGEPTSGNKGYDVLAVVGIDSNPDERIKSWRSLHESMVGASRQLEGGTSGIIAVHYPDPIANFETLRPADEPMVLVMAKWMESRRQVGAIMLSTEPDLQLPGSEGAGTARSYVNQRRLPASLLGTAM